jgi:hypothetical protein
MEAGVPDVVLSWDVTAVPAGKNVYLQRLAGEQPVGAPVPMTQLESITVSESAAFEIALAELQQATVELQPGWNLVGIPLMTTATLAELFPEPARSGVAVTCYSWDGSEYGAVDLGQVLNPERGYWLHVDQEARSATFSGIVADGVLVLAGTVGWRLFSPPSRQPVPATVPFLGPLWRFETATRRYLGVALDTPLEPGLAYWGFIP